MTSDGDRWNHNIEYHRLILHAVVGASRVLDVGCGDGQLTRALGVRGQRTVGLDRDAAILEHARAQGGPNVAYVRADVLDAPFGPRQFDAVVSVAALHHVDMTLGLTHMAELLRPGGVLAIIGIARSRRLLDIPWDAAAAIATRVHQLRTPLWEHSAPICWPPAETFASARRSALAALPGAVFRRHLLWRYSLVWRAPPNR